METENDKIEEIILENNNENNETVIEEEIEITPEPEIKEVEPKPKKKAGRPPESKDKKQRPPRKKVVIEEEPVELPRAIPDSLPIPQYPEDDNATIMLKLLQHQAQIRKNKKTDLWRSWFQ